MQMSAGEAKRVRGGEPLRGLTLHNRQEEREVQRAAGPTKGQGELAAAMAFKEAKTKALTDAGAAEAWAMGRAWTRTALAGDRTATLLPHVLVQLAPRVIVSHPCAVQHVATRKLSCPHIVVLTAARPTLRAVKAKGARRIGSTGATIIASAICVVYK